MNQNDKDPYQQFVQENECDTCKEILKDLHNILNDFPDVRKSNFPADTLHFDSNPINQFIFPVCTSVQPDLNANPINQVPVDVSNDDSICTPSNNLPLRKSTDVLENGPNKKRARTQVKKSERNAKNTLFCHHGKNHVAKVILPTFPVMIEP